MLSSIHPLGERSRSNRYWLTVSGYLAGSLLGGLATGAVAGGLGWILGIGDVDGTVRALLLAALSASVIAADSRSRPVTHTRRQVDEHWMNRYRGWVYGLGYGLQLGCGLVTIVSSATVYLWIGVAFLSGSVAAGAAFGAVFGLVRGAILCSGMGLDSPERLRTFHRSLDERRLVARRAGMAGTALVLLLAVVVAAA
jgi:hypothetical protein